MVRWAVERDICNPSIYLSQPGRHATIGSLASKCICSQRYQLRCRQVRSLTRLKRSKRRKSGCTANSATAQDSLDNIPYEVVRPASKPGSYELRLYQPRFIVEMLYKSRAIAYMEFDKYLTGNNDDKLHLETMTPVVMRHNPSEGTKTMQMFVRSLGSFSKDSLSLTQQPPLPSSSQLSLNIAGGEVIAALTFSGQATRESSIKAAESLRRLLQQDGISLAADEEQGLFTLAQFDPVHSLRERTNELWLAVSM